MLPRRVLACAAALAAVIAVAGCASGGPPISGDSRNVGDVTVTLRIEPARVKAGQGVRLALNLQNNSGRERTLVYPSGKRYDFWVTGEGGEVWRWSEGRSFTQAVESEIVAGSSGKRFVETWRPDGPGRYVGHARLFAEGFEGELDGEIVVR